MQHRFGLLALIGVLTLLFSTNRVAAQQGKNVTQASARLSKLVDAGNNDGFQLHNNSFSLGGGWLKKNQNDWIALYTVQLTAGKQYRFLAAGDNEASDVDIRVTDAAGKQVAVDDSTAADAVVNYAPKVSGRYAVHIRLYESKGDVDCVCISAVMVK